MKAEYIEVSAQVRYWEDARINGKEDEHGELVPLKNGSLWVPEIRLADGQIMEWPEGTEASIHYKVADQGEYWLLNEARDRIAKWKGSYVPDDFLCHGDEGYGDYIIFKVDPAGKIIGWIRPDVDPERWVHGA